MSRSPQFEADPVDQPAATDPVERRTWSAMRIRIGDRTVTRLWDKSLDAERTLLYVPVFPIALWIVRNWWNLFYEASRAEELPRTGTTKEQFSWMKRHNLRSADSGTLLPSLFFFNNGQSLRAEWHADQPDALSHMPRRFVDGGSESLHIELAKAAIAQFINETLDRVRGVNDERIAELLADWRAIQTADTEESQFCIIAGRMGLDPYDSTDVHDQLAGFIEENLRDPELPVVRDLTEVAEASTLADQWKWIQETSDFYRIRRTGTGQQAALVKPEWTTPARQGYELAWLVTAGTDLDRMKPVPSVEELAKPFTDRPLLVESNNHIPGTRLRAVVGRTHEKQGIVAGAVPEREDNRRFFVARGLYHALFGSAKGERLITNAFTWDQQASRAFAAELLAPRRALVNRITDWEDDEQITQLANEFKISAKVIENQLRNARLHGFD